jgi:CubicO group peptidase (beta-lactamase class C family)
MFTAATVMSLVDDGTIALDAPVTRYVPYAHCAAPARMDEVTVHDVLTHTSGYRDQLEFPTLPWPGNGTAASALKELFEAFDPTLRSAPGAEWSYSNLGYALAGLVAEEAAGKPFTELVKQRVLTKSGMETATFDPAEAAQRRHAVGAGHMQQGGPVVDIETDTLLGDVRRRPITGLQASVVDVAHWVETVLGGGGTALRKESVARMTSALVPTGAGDVSYGYGFFVDPHHGGEVRHDGGQSGFVSNVVMVPEARFGVVLVFSGEGADIATISNHAIALFLGK